MDLVPRAPARQLRVGIASQLRGRRAGVCVGSERPHGQRDRLPGQPQLEEQHPGMACIADGGRILLCTGGCCVLLELVPGPQSPYSLFAAQGHACVAAGGGHECDGRRPVRHREAHGIEQGAQLDHHALLGRGGVHRRVRSGDAMGSWY